MQPKRIQYTVFSLLMALLMLITSVSYAVDMHYCKGELKSYSLWGKAKSCHDSSQQKKCPHHKHIAKKSDHKSLEKKNDCCENKTIVLHVEIDKDIQLEWIESSLAVKAPIFVASHISSCFNIFQEPIKEFIGFQYITPQPRRDIYALFESYLI